MEKEAYAMNRHPLKSPKGYIVRKEQLEKCKQQFKSFWSDSITNFRSTLPRRPLNIFSLPGALSSNSNISNEDIKELETKRNEFNQRQRRQFLIACLKLLTSSKQCISQPDVLLDESRHLFKKQARDLPAVISNLDEHLIFVSLHWPLKLKEPFKDSICPSSILFKSLQSWEEVVQEIPFTARRMDKILLYISKAGNFPYLIKAENVDKNNCLLFKGKILSNGSKVEVSLQGFNIDVGAKVEIRFYRRVRRSLYWNRDVDVVIGFGQHGPRAELTENLSFFRWKNVATTSMKEDEGMSNNDLHDRKYKKNPTDASSFRNLVPNTAKKHSDILEYDSNLDSSSTPMFHFPTSFNCDMAYSNNKSNAFPTFHDNGLFSDEKENERTKKICDKKNQCAEYHENEVNECGSRTLKDFDKDKRAAENLLIHNPIYANELTTRKNLEGIQSTMSLATVSIKSEEEKHERKLEPEELVASEQLEDVLLQPQWKTNSFSSTKMSNEDSILHRSSFTRTKTSTEKTPIEKNLLALKDYLPLKM